MKESKIEAKRKFWEAAFCACLSIQDMAVSESTQFADEAFVEWEQRFGDQF